MKLLLLQAILGLGRLIVLYDDNGISIDGKLDITCSDNAPNRFAALGWHVQSVDGHDMGMLLYLLYFDTA